MHLHQTRIEVIKPNYKQQETTQLLARQPMTENQTLPELLANFSTALEALAPHLTVVKVRIVTPPSTPATTRHDLHQHKIRTCSGKGNSVKRKNTGERATRRTKRAQARRNNPPTPGDREEEEERRRRIDKQEPKWEKREEGENSCAHRTGLMGGENCTRRKSDTSTRELCAECEEATPLQDYNEHTLNGCAGCRPARHNWSHARHYPYGESIPYERRQREETYAFHASACPLSGGSLPQSFMEDMLNHPRPGRISATDIILGRRPRRITLNRGEQTHLEGCLLCESNIGPNMRFTRHRMYINNLMEHWHLYGAAHSERIATVVEAGVHVNRGREFTDPSASPHCAHRHGPEGEIICHRPRSQIGANTRVPPTTEHDDRTEHQTIAFDDYLCSECRAAIPPRLHPLERIRFGNRTETHTSTGAPFDMATNGDTQSTNIGCPGCDIRHIQDTSIDDTAGGAGGRNT